MSLRLYNTLTRQLETFAPVKDDEARLYLCGMTPYDYAHAGNARSAVAFDVLVRHLRARSYRVTYVRNITDVDDKILERAKQNGEPPLDLVEPDGRSSTRRTCATSAVSTRRSSPR